MHLTEKRADTQLEKRSEMKLIPGGNQMCLIRDTEEVLKFLEFVGRKSILNERSVHFRLTACNNLFSVLNEEEDNLEYILSNLDLLVHRFRNRNTSVCASTMKVYKSRVKSSIEDFRAWSADPFAWERQVSEKAKLHSTQRKATKKSSAKTKSAEIQTIEENIETEGEINTLLSQPAPLVAGKTQRKVFFPIRNNCTIEMTLPVEGITQKELKRIGMFLLPYCSDFESISQEWPSVF